MIWNVSTLLSIFLFACTQTPAIQSRVEQTLADNTEIVSVRLPPGHPDVVVAAWTVGDASEPAGYALRVRGESRSGYFLAVVILDAHFTIKQVHVEEYIGERGSEIRQKGFREQFEGKTPASALRVGEDVDAVTGATISSRALANAVREGVTWFRKWIRDKG